MKVLFIFLLMLSCYLVGSKWPLKTVIQLIKDKFKKKNG